MDRAQRVEVPARHLPSLNEVIPGSPEHKHREENPARCRRRGEYSGILSMTYSLVIISRTRPAFLERLLGYCAEAERRVPIFLGDASSRESLHDVARVVKLFQGRLPLVYA